MSVLHEVSGYAIRWGLRGPTDETIAGAANTYFCFQRGCFDEDLRGDREILLTQDLYGPPPEFERQPDGTFSPQDANRLAHWPLFARRSDGTLDIVSDDVGLLVTARLLDSPANRILVKNKIPGNLIRGWSHRWDGDFLGRRHRRQGNTELVDIVEARLLELTLVINKKSRMEVDGPVFISGGLDGVAPPLTPTWASVREQHIRARESARQLEGIAQ